VHSHGQKEVALFAHRLVLASQACLVLTAWSGPADPSPPDRTGVDDEPRRGYLTFYIDNDLFSGEDRDYTNGARLSWISEGRPALGILPARDVLEKLAGTDEGSSLVRRLSGFSRDAVQSGEVTLNYGLSLTQLMYTPRDPKPATQPPGQRRYAGWLALGFSLHARSARVLNSAELLLGTPGPRSQADDAQDWIHELRGFEKFQGWGDQIPNEITLDLSVVQKRRARFLERPERSLSIDGYTQWGARLGTFRTLAHAGGLFRVGFHLPPDFSDPRISPTAYSHRYFQHQGSAGSHWSLYGLVGANLSAVLFDATLDGPLFKNFETGNTREPWVLEGYLGFGVRWRRLELSYVHTWRGEEYAEQPGGADFGSVALRLQL
jgi:lipid A 3-O-deacylase